MQTHAIVEVEEGSLAVTLGVREGRSVRIRRCMRMPLPDLGREALTSILRSLANDQLQGVKGVHVILGERRVQHLVTTVPKMPSADVGAFVTREALRITGMPSAEELLVAARLVRRLPGGKLVVGATAMARSVWEPIHAAFRAADLDVVGLHSLESCLGLGVPKGLGDRIAVVECSAGRARFVLCDGEAVMQVRRFLVGTGAEGSASALATQLAMELPRTLDWLRETGHSLPQALVLGHRIDLDDATCELIRGDLPKILRAPGEARVAEGEARPSLGSTALLQRLVADQRVPSLLDPVRLALPWSPAQVLWSAAAAATAMACTWSAVADGRALVAARAEVFELAAERQLQAVEVARASSATTAGSPVPVLDRPLLVALGLRRPCSRLVAEVSNSGDEGVCLELLSFSTNERVVLAGVVEGQSRREALTTLIRFAQRVRSLPFLEDSGPEDIGEVAGRANSFRFKISLAWRNS